MKLIRSDKQKITIESPCLILTVKVPLFKIKVIILNLLTQQNLESITKLYRLGIDPGDPTDWIPQETMLNYLIRGDKEAPGKVTDLLVNRAGKKYIALAI